MSMNHQSYIDKFFHTMNKYHNEVDVLYQLDPEFNLVDVVHTLMDMDEEGVCQECV